MVIIKRWKSAWKSSKQPRKQRLYRYNAQLHLKARFLHSNLSKPLRKKYGRSIRVRKGDKVRIMRGSFKGHTGKVEMVDVKKGKIYIEKIEQVKKEGSKSLMPFHPSNVQIAELETSDKRRFKQTEKKLKPKTEVL